MEKHYLCYSCQKVFSFGDLAYECMCINPDDEIAMYRGVCKGCAEQNREIKIAPGHSLKKIHTYSEEFHNFWKEIQKTYPNCGCFSTEDNGITVSYMEDDITGERGNKIFGILNKRGISNDPTMKYGKIKDIKRKASFL